MTLILPPPLAPDSAGYRLRSTLNSAIESILGVLIKVAFDPRSTLSAPSTVQELAELRAPLIAKGMVAVVPPGVVTPTYNWSTADEWIGLGYWAGQCHARGAERYRGGGKSQPTRKCPAAHRQTNLS